MYRIQVCHGRIFMERTKPTYDASGECAMARILGGQLSQHHQFLSLAEVPSGKWVYMRKGGWTPAQVTAVMMLDPEKMQ